jgi:hypothetical protein
MRAIVLVVCMLRVANAAPVGTLDVDLAQTDKGWVLSDSIFEVTFPSKPTLDIEPITTPTGIKIPGMNASVDRDHASYGVAVFAAPHEMPYDATRGLGGARDQTLAAAHAKLVSDKPDVLGGRPAQHVVAITSSPSQRLDLYLQWDGDHRTMFMVMALVTGTAQTSFGKDFVASFRRHDGPRWPIDPPAPDENTPEPTKVLDFELVRHGTKFTVRDSLFEATFPTRPLVTNGDAAPAVGMDARTFLGEADLFSTGVLVVPKDTAIDTNKLLGQAAELELTDLTAVKHVDKPGKVAGMDGKHITFTGIKENRPVRGELHIAWVPAQRMIVVGLVYTPAKAVSAMQRAFLASLTIHPKGSFPTR